MLEEGRRGGEGGACLALLHPSFLLHCLSCCSRICLPSASLSQVPSFLCDLCCPLSSKPLFTSLDPQPTSLTSLPPWLNVPLLAFLPALAYGIGVKLRPLKLRPATQLPAGCRKEKRPRSNPTCNLWTAFQPPIPDWSSAFNEHLGLRTSAVQEA